MYRAGPYADMGKNKDPIYHGTKVISKIIGRTSAPANRAILKSVKINVVGGGMPLEFSVVDGMLKIYDDIVDNYKGKPVVINISLSISEKRFGWSCEIIRRIFRKLRDMGDVIVVTAAGNSAPGVQISMFPATLAGEAEFEDFVIPVGGVTRGTLENKYQTAPWMKVWAAGTVKAPKGAKRGWGSVSGTSFASPQVAALLAYFRGMGMTKKQAIRALYEYAYERMDPEVEVEGPRPRVAYTGILGTGCGDDALHGPQDWDLFFRNKERGLNLVPLNPPHATFGKRDGTSPGAPACRPYSNSSSPSSNLASKNTPTPSPTTSSLSYFNHWGPEPELGLLVPDEEDTLAPDPVTPVNGAVLWQPWDWILGRVLIGLGGVIDLVADIGGTTTTIKTTIKGLKSGDVVALSTLLPSSIRARISVTNAPPLVTSIMQRSRTEAIILETASGDPPISLPSSGTEFVYPTSMPITDTPSPTPLVITGPSWTSTLNNSMAEPPLSWVTLENALRKIPSTFQTSTPTLAAEHPKDSAIHYCNGLKVADAQVASNEKYQFVYQFANRESIATGIRQVCARVPEKGLQNKGGGWRQMFFEGSPEAFELDLIWDNEYPKIEQCQENFFRILDDCDNDRAENPWGWKAGGIRKATGLDAAIYRIDTIYSRKPPAKIWGACYLNKRWFDFGNWRGGMEYVIWGFGWLDAVDVHREPDGNEKFRAELGACNMIEFHWRFVSGPLKPDTPWEWRAQVITGYNEDGNTCVEKVLQKWSKIPGLKCTDKDLERDVTYLPGDERAYVKPKGVVN
ncbi:hypothetical protein TWF730_011050 [Orbilia blumenaviensis]|uniref:Peptidase S8/S53 domain-containing protein n=1 Tax=Orbilia blumenaviensis TaxID=1796055 RepID=A0AAV9UQG4_9PEZI